MSVDALLKNNTKGSLFYLLQRHTEYPAAFWYNFRHHGFSCDKMVEIGLGWRLRQIIEANTEYVKYFYVNQQKLGRDRSRSENATNTSGTKTS
jgi:hypothetical protein